MKTLEVYDKPMCCSTGICGPEINPALPRFAADLDWLKSRGFLVERFNLAQQPMAFTKNPEVHRLLVREGPDCLPVLVVDGTVMSRGEYPSRETLAKWMGASPKEAFPPNSNPASCCGASTTC